MKQFFLALWMDVDYCKYWSVGAMLEKRFGLFAKLFYKQMFTLGYMYSRKKKEKYQLFHFSLGRAIMAVYMSKRKQNSEICIWRCLYVSQNGESLYKNRFQFSQTNEESVKIFPVCGVNLNSVNLYLMIYIFFLFIVVVQNLEFLNKIILKFVCDFLLFKNLFLYL